MRYYVDIKGKTAGPYTLDQIKVLRESGSIEDTFLYATDESKDWMPISLLVPLFDTEENKPIPTSNQSQPTIIINNQSNNQGYPFSASVGLVGVHKSRLIYILLALFLGGLGIHNFYIGRNNIGIVQLLITIITCGWGVIISAIWALIEIFVIDKDSNNVPMI